MSDEEDKAKKPPRKISCLPCRSKKARCDIGLPHCNRCIRNNRTDKCIYPKPRAFGRPPKNAIFQKSQDMINAVTTTKSNKKSTSSTAHEDKTACREFIFEYKPVDNIEPALHIPQVVFENRLVATGNNRQVRRYRSQITDIERIFSLYLSRGSDLRAQLQDFQPHGQQFKIKSLHQHFTWLSSSMINNTIRRSCQYFHHDSFFDPEITITAFIKQDAVKVFFFNSTSKQNSPLESVPTDQAIQLFDYFFLFFPYSILLNKTKLLQDYWQDRIDPLLVCVIYGITIYTCQHILKDKPFVLWNSSVKRNPFLNYAYVLLEKFFIERDKHRANPMTTPRPSSLGNYQAVFLLGIFETLFGLPKHGMTIISLSYMIAADLGLFIRTEEGEEGPSHKKPMKNTDMFLEFDAVERELLMNTYWAALRSTSYGCVELGLYMRDPLLFHNRPYPPVNHHYSASYQHDKAHNNETSSTCYLIESFYIETVVTYFSTKLFSCIPKTELNLFGCATESGDVTKQHIAIRKEQQSKQHLLFVFSTTAPPSSTALSTNTNTMVDYKVQLVLNDFQAFITQNSHQWSCMQVHAITTTYHLYCMHFKFLKPFNNVLPLRYHHTFLPGILDITNVTIASKFTDLLSTTKALTDILLKFLVDYGHITSKDQTELLPLNLTIAALETTVETTLYQYQLPQPQAEDMMEHLKTMSAQLETLHQITKHSIWVQTEYTVTVRLIQKKIRDFLKLHPISFDTAVNTSTVSDPVNTFVTHDTAEALSLQLLPSTPYINYNAFLQYQTSSLLFDNSMYFYDCLPTSSTDVSGCSADADVADPTSLFLEPEHNGTTVGAYAADLYYNTITNTTDTSFLLQGEFDRLFQ